MSGVWVGVTVGRRWGWRKADGGREERGGGLGWGGGGVKWTDNRHQDVSCVESNRRVSLLAKYYY